MSFLRKYIVIIWWLTAFSAANGAWFFIANISVGGFLQRALQPYIDNTFYIAAAFVFVAALIAFWSMFHRSTAGQKLLTKIWLIYMGLYALFAAGVVWFFSSVAITVS